MRHNSRYFFLVALFGQEVQIINWPANILDKTNQNKTKQKKTGLINKQNRTNQKNKTGLIKTKQD